MEKNDIMVEKDKGFILAPAARKLLENAKTEAESRKRCSQPTGERLMKVLADDLRVALKTLYKIWNEKPVQSGILLRVHSALAAQKRMAEFSPRAIATIEGRGNGEPLHYFHLTIMKTPRGGHVHVWKHHALRFKYVGAAFEAETESVTGDLDTPTREYRYYLYGNDNRCFIYGREKGNIEVDGPGERIFPRGSIPEDRARIAWAGIGLWRATAGPLVFSKCLLLSPQAVEKRSKALTPLPVSGHHFVRSKGRPLADVNECIEQVWRGLWPDDVIDLARLK